MDEYTKREENRRAYLIRKQNGICTGCGRPSDREWPDGRKKTRCHACAEDDHIRTYGSKHWLTRPQYWQEHPDKEPYSAICQYCGQFMIEVEVKVVCAVCPFLRSLLREVRFGRFAPHFLWSAEYLWHTLPAWSYQFNQGSKECAVSPRITAAYQKLMSKILANKPFFIPAEVFPRRPPWEAATFLLERLRDNPSFDELIVLIHTQREAAYAAATPEQHAEPPLVPCNRDNQKVVPVLYA